jgi:hypothetical protein
MRGIGVVRRFKHDAIRGEFPAVIETADAAIFDSRQQERGAAVHAEFVQQADPAVGVAKRDKVLAKQPDMKRIAVGRQLLGRADRHPVPAHHVAQGCSGSDSCDEFVLLMREHVRLLDICRQKTAQSDILNSFGGVSSDCCNSSPNSISGKWRSV